MAIAGLALCCPAVAFAAEAAIPLAQKALKAGKPDLAIKAMNVALASNGLKGAEIARAYYVRGLAQAKARNPAAAIADLSHALWLKGLSDTERAEATAAKAAAYQTAGIADTPAESAPVAAGAAAVAEAATIVVPEVPATTISKARKSKSKPAAPDAAALEQTASVEALPWNAEAASAAPKPTEVAQSESNSFSAVLGSLFGGGQLTAPEASAPPTAEPAKLAAVEVQPSIAEAAKPAGKAAKTGLFLQIASLRSEADAQAAAAKLAGDHAATLAGVETAIAPSVIGNMGTFYNVRLGPVASKAAGQTLCAQLRREGVDCFFAAP